MIEKLLQTDTDYVIAHLPDGWSMNWFGTKNGEGTEYHVLLLALLLNR
jgi:putative oxidoreductase